MDSNYTPIASSMKPPLCFNECMWNEPLSSVGFNYVVPQGGGPSPVSNFLWVNSELLLAYLYSPFMLTHSGSKIKLLVVCNWNVRSTRLRLHFYSTCLQHRRFQSINKCCTPPRSGWKPFSRAFDVVFRLDLLSFLIVITTACQGLGY
jgi:hypothetical protein